MAEKPEAVSRRIILHPGVVQSAADGPAHYIGAGQLLRLYHIPENWPRIVLDSPEARQAFENQDGDVHVYPKSSGEYFDLPEWLLTEKPPFVSS